MVNIRGLEFDFLSRRYVRSSDFSKSSSRYHFLKGQDEIFYDNGDIFKDLVLFLNFRRRLSKDQRDHFKDKSLFLANHILISKIKGPGTFTNCTFLFFSYQFLRRLLYIFRTF